MSIHHHTDGTRPCDCDNGCMFCVRPRRTGVRLSDRIPPTTGSRPVREVIEDDYSDYHCDSAMEAGLFGSDA